MFNLCKACIKHDCDFSNINVHDVAVFDSSFHKHILFPGDFTFLFS